MQMVIAFADLLSYAAPVGQAPAVANDFAAFQAVAYRLNCVVRGTAAPTGLCP